MNERSEPKATEKNCYSEKQAINVAGEPTTDEIVSELRRMQNAGQVVLDSGFGTHEGEHDTIYRKRRDIAKNAADRLESQQRDVANLTAERDAEKARADAAVADLKFGRICMTCKHDEKRRKEVSETNQTQCINKQRWQWRGEKGKAKK